MNNRTIILFYTFLFIGFLSFSQSKQELEIKESFWGASDAYKNAIDIPAKWENESAVVIYKNENYDFHKYGKTVNYVTSYRVRMKLLDKAALEEFSEFSFKKRSYNKVGFGFGRGKSNKTVGIKVVKPDGTELEIDVHNDTVEVDGESKVAISNLEIGDILDFYIYSEEKFKSTYAFGFDPVETTLEEDYPIMDYKLFFETENDFFINFKSYNGAPELKEISTDKNSLRRYELVAKDLEKADYPRWFYPLVEMPAYKFQVYFARSGKFENKAMAFLPEKEDIIKTSVSKEEILNLYDSRFYPDGDYKAVKKHLKSKTYSPHKMVEEAYYYMRHFYFTRYLEAVMVERSKIMYSPFMYYTDDLTFIQNQKHFISFFAKFLKSEKIDYDIVIAKKRFDGPIQDLLIEKNVNVMIKVNTPTPLYLTYFDLYTTTNQYSAFIEGSDIYLLTAEKIKIDGISNGYLPTSNYNTNEINRSMNITFHEDFDGFKLDATNKYKGHAKWSEQDLLLIYRDVVDEDYEKYQTERFVDKLKGKKNIAHVTKELNALDTKLREEQLETFTDNAKREYETDKIENYNYNIVSTGRYSIDDYLEYTESFDINDEFIKKAGPNYLIEVGKFIGGQIDISEEEKTRTENIYRDYPRVINYTMSFKIPEGYSVSGLDKLNIAVDNSTGGFESTAKLDGNILHITTKKTYKNNYEPNANWPQMVEFLEAAYKFSTEKILLKRN